MSVLLPNEPALLIRKIRGVGLLASIFCFMICNGCDSLSPIESNRETAKLGKSPDVTKAAKTDSDRHLQSGEGLMDWVGPKREIASRFLRAPRLEIVEVPDYVGANSIWGATGRDRQGRMYFGVAGYGVDDPSAALWRLDPDTGEFETLGLVNQQLDRLGVRREIDWPETQMKIHSKIYQAADGRMYFSTQDEHEEMADGSRNALYGGRLFALEPESKTWESILVAPEGLIAIAVRGRYVVAQGYFGHVLYQYDTSTKEVKSVKLGTYKGHASRNIFMDSKGHVYGIRARLAKDTENDGVYVIEQDRVRISLVELDTDLDEVRDWPLSDYAPTGNTDSHGITGFCEMNDGSIVLVTHSGALWQLQRDENGNQLARLGWMHPTGSAASESLFSPCGERFVSGFVDNKNHSYDWVVFDIQKRKSVVLPLSQSSINVLNQNGILVYGCDTLDDAGRAYVAGWKRKGDRLVPHVIRLNWD